jgi:hypothetical protein
MPVNRLLDGTKRLRGSGADFDADAVDKACQKASNKGFLNSDEGCGGPVEKK